MVAGVNLEEVKKYNNALKQYKDQAAALNAEIDYTNRELDALCAELTTELGVQVTRDNVEQIYNEQVTKINSTLQSGTAVLAKIQSEEAADSQPAPQTVVQPQVATPVASQVAPQPQVQAPVAPQVQPVVQPHVQATIPQPQIATPVAPQPTPVAPTVQSIPTPVAGSVFGNPALSGEPTIPTLLSL
jgi:hypothetical protein